MNVNPDDTPTRSIGGIPVHPAADLFPEMEGEEFDALCDSVRAHGVRQPLVYYRGKLLDGRNRLRAAIVCDIDPTAPPHVALDEGQDPYRFVYDANCQRKSYSPQQKAALRMKVAEASGELRRVQEEASEKANESRSEKAKEQPREGGGFVAKAGDRSRDPSPAKAEGAAVDRYIAKQANVSISTVKRVRQLKEKDLDAFEALAAGKNAPQQTKSKAPRTRKQSAPSTGDTTLNHACTNATPDALAQWARDHFDLESLFALGMEVLRMAGPPREFATKLKTYCDCPGRSIASLTEAADVFASLAEALRAELGATSSR